MLTQLKRKSKANQIVLINKISVLTVDLGATTLHASVGFGDTENLKVQYVLMGLVSPKIFVTFPPDIW